MNLKIYTSISKAITKLFDPLAEVVIHDVQSNTIAFICGALSKRNVGDPSLLDLDQLHNDDLSQVSYPKLSFDGRLIKSISIPIEENGELTHIMCINCDVSLFEQMRSLANSLLPNSEQEQPESLFNNDWQERLHKAIHAHLKKQDWPFEDLNTVQKKDLVHHLYKQGAFHEKNAADYIAKILNMGRATIFKYLKNWKGNTND